jgi:hypothetical protein
MTQEHTEYAKAIVQRLLGSIEPYQYPPDWVEEESENVCPSEPVGRAALVEAMALVDAACGPESHFSLAIHHLNEDQSTVWPHKGKLLLELLKSLIEHLNSSARQASGAFVSADRITELSGIRCGDFDLTKLIQFCRELNITYSHRCFFATAGVLRALVDHVPPIFGAKDFSQVANNTPFPKSVRESIQHLDRSLRSIADATLHRQIGKKETLPTVTQVGFQADLDVLLAQVVERLDINHG